MTEFYLQDDHNSILYMNMYIYIYRCMYTHTHGEDHQDHIVICPYGWGWSSRFLAGEFLWLGNRSHKHSWLVIVIWEHARKLTDFVKLIGSSDFRFFFFVFKFTFFSDGRPWDFVDMRTMDVEMKWWSPNFTIERSQS